MPINFEGNLLNSPADVVIDTIISLLTIGSYLPQILRINTTTSPRGISGYFILFDVVLSNTQLSYTLLCAAYAWPTERNPVLLRIGDGRLTGLPALGGILGHVQIFAQWCCSVLVLLLFSIKGRNEGLRGKSTLLLVAFTHAATVLFPVFAITLPKPSVGHTWGRDIYMALTSRLDIVIALCSVLAQFYAQLQEMQARKGDAGTLSLLSVALQVLASAALAVRWFLRVGRPFWNSDEWVPPMWERYEWGFPVANYVLRAVAYALLLACYYCYCLGSRGRREQDALQEGEPLLA